MDTIKSYGEPTVLLVVVGSSRLELNYARNVLDNDWSLNLFFCGDRKSISEHKQVLTKTLDNFPMCEIVVLLLASDETDSLKHGLTLSRIAKNRGLVSVVVSQNIKGSVVSREKLGTYTDSLLLCPRKQKDENWLARCLGKKWIQKKNLYQYTKKFIHVMKKIETTTGFINLDSADISSVLKNAGTVYCWEETVESENSSEWFDRMLCQSGTLKERITTARRGLLWVEVPLDCDLEKIEHVARSMSEHFLFGTKILFGAEFNKDLSDELYIGMFVTEFDS